MPHRILYLNSNGKLWGEGHSLIRLIQHLDRNLFEPVVCCGYEGPLTEALRSLGVPVHIVKTRMWRKGKNIPFVPATLAQLLLLITRERIDLIHNNSFWVNPYGAISGQISNRPVVTHIRDTIPYDKVRKYTLWRADQVIAVSESAAHSVLKHPDISDRLNVIYNAVDLAEIDAAPADPELRAAWGVREGSLVAGELATLAPRKGQDLLIEAAYQLRDFSPPLHLVFIGSANTRYNWYEERLRSRVKDMGLESRVTFAGYTREPLSAVKSFDISVLPSRSEGFARALIESMALRIPTIASDIPGNDEAIRQGETGLLVQPESIEGLAQAIAQLAGDPALRQRFGDAARQDIEARFTIENQVKQIQTLYSRLLNNNE